MDISKRIVLLLCLMGSFVCAYAQKEHVVTGVVRDAKGEVLIGANVVVKNQPGLGVIVGADGKYKIKTAKNETLIFSFIGYEALEIPVEGKTVIDAVLSDSKHSLNEFTVVGAGVQRKVSVVGAITSVDIDNLKIPTSNLTNSLAGNVAGVIAVQRSGEPGENKSEFWIRGISTFGANSGALVLVDGIEREFNEVNPEDIQSFSVLKDASATAIYGQRGANGVILITTRRGLDGKVKINFKSEFGNNKSSQRPKYVEGMQYSAMANEARKSRYQDPLYDASDLEIIGYHLDPDLYPNINWYDEVLKKSTSNYRSMLNISGGGSTARYYLSGGYYNEDGIYKTNSMNDYNTNSNYRRYNFRLNVDVNITKTTVLEAGIGGWVANQDKPGSSSDEIWGSLSRLTPTTVPLRYSNGLWPTYGRDRNQMNPYVLLTETGYKTISENKMETNLGLKQDLDFITPRTEICCPFFVRLLQQRSGRSPQIAVFV